MSTEKSLFNLILPLWIQSSLEVDKAVYPFLAPFDLGDYSIEEAQEVITEICEWLNLNIGPVPKWGIDRETPDWLSDNEINMIFLFKTEKDAVAFKLRWM